MYNLRVLWKWRWRSPVYGSWIGFIRGVQVPACLFWVGPLYVTWYTRKEWGRG